MKKAERRDAQTKLAATKYDLWERNYALQDKIRSVEQVSHKGATIIMREDVQER